MHRSSSKSLCASCFDFSVCVCVCVCGKTWTLAIYQRKIVYRFLLGFSSTGFPESWAQPSPEGGCRYRVPPGLEAPVCTCVSFKLGWLPAAIGFKAAEEQACDRTAASSAAWVCKDPNCHTHARTRGFAPHQLKTETRKQGRSSQKKPRRRGDAGTRRQILAGPAVERGETDAALALEATLT